MGRDAGVTLVEFMVAMMIFTVVIAVFMGGLVVMTRSTARAQAVAEAGDDVRLAFQRMDKQVRYASAINRPGAGPSGAVYVEFRTTAVQPGDDPFCTQWRYVPSQGLLQVRSWDDVGAASPGAWNTLIDDVRNTSDEAPFTFVPADDQRLHQQLRVHLLVGPYDRAGAESQTTFVARNSSADSSTNADMSPADGQSDTRVCISTGGRP
jgi:prepilin-type N-terminal cleavage/methylation domain-containing protein